MSKSIIFSFMLIVSLSACFQKDAKEQTSVPVPDAEQIDLKLTDLATDKDLVCGMSVEEGSIADTTTYEGKIYGFCAPECKEAFLADPATYLAQQ